MRRVRRFPIRGKLSPAKINTSKNSLICPTPRFFTETQFISLIHASKTTKQLRQIHAQIILQNQSSNSRIITQMISSSSFKKSVNYGLLIFRQFDDPNLFLFNTLIRALADNSYYMSSISYFLVMLRSNVRPDWLTFPFVLKSAAALQEVGFGMEVHGEILQMGFEFNQFVRISLMDMYAKVDLLCFALKLFDESPEKSEVRSTLLWNILINGYCKEGNWRRAVELFNEMPGKNAGSWSSLINGLIKAGQVNRAIRLFNSLPEKDVVSWTMMVHGLSQNGHHQQALSAFFQMVNEGVKPNDHTVVSALLACTKAGALETGARIQNYITSNGFKLTRGVATALVDMYAKCGSIESAKSVFVMVKEKDLLTWSVMIWGCAIHGFVDQALHWFSEMKSAGVKPDEVIFLAILTACSHAGQVDKGLRFFEIMKHDYYIEPTLKHYAVMVDLYGRAGQLNEALSFIKRMPIGPDFVIWGTLFCACRAHKNIKLAEYASERLLELEPKHPGSYVFLSNVYAAVGRWSDVERVRTLMKTKGVDKEPGWSYIEVEGQVHNFVAGDHAHARAKEIYLKLDEISTSARQQGYMPETEWVLHNIEEEEKEDALGSHSEKLALAFGLLCTAPGATIRIVKNLRVCGDCHTMMKFASKMTQRDIVLRDIKRFHHFKDGICSCQDHW